MTHPHPSSFTWLGRLSTIPARRQCLSGRILAVTRCQASHGIRRQYSSSLETSEKAASDEAAPPRGDSRQLSNYRAYIIPGEAGRALRIKTDQQPEEANGTFIGLVHLRDACDCAECVDPVTGQKNFPTTRIGRQLNTHNVRVQDGILHVEWLDDLGVPGKIHRSEYSNLRAIFRGKRWGHQNPVKHRILWDKESLESKLIRIPYDMWMAGGFEFVKAVHALHYYGIVVLQGVPQEETAVEQIMIRLGNIHETIRGRSFDIHSESQGESTLLHTDMPWLNDGGPPRIKALHCLNNDADGGEIAFVDGQRALRYLASFDASMFKMLENNPIHFRHKTPEHSFQSLQPIAGGQLYCLRWSPLEQDPQQSPLMPLDNRLLFWDSVRDFENLIYDESNRYDYQPKPGECVLFDNWRVLNATKAFTVRPGGQRHLRGAYVSGDVFKARLNAAGRTEEDPIPQFDEFKLGEMSESRQLADALGKGNKGFAGVRFTSINARGPLDEGPGGRDQPSRPQGTRNRRS